MKRRPNPKRLSRRGFTLVEMVISLGIVGFAFIGILGLLPFGLQSFRSAMDNTLQTQMTQRLVGQVNQSDPDELSSLDGKFFYFDDNGIEVSSNSPVKTYEAVINLENEAVLPLAAGLSNTNVTQVRITFTHKSNNSPGRQVGSFVAYIAPASGGTQP